MKYVRDGNAARGKGRVMPIVGAVLLPVGRRFGRPASNNVKPGEWCDAVFAVKGFTILP